MANATYLIDHWSYSSLKEFTNNRYGWVLSYVLKTHEFKTSVAGLVGQAAHKAAEAINKGKSVDEGITEGLTFLTNYPDKKIKWGKTGSREKAISVYTFAINAYLAEAPKPYEILLVEEPITEFLKPIPEFFSLENANFALPLKAIPDLVKRNSAGEIEIDDLKFVGSSKSESDDAGDESGSKEDPARILQGICLFHVVYAKFNERPKRINFIETKTSKNKDGSPQVKITSIEFDDPALLAHFSAFYRLYDACTNELAREDALFIPNFSDMFNGSETYQLFVGEVAGMDRPKAVIHKTEEADIKEYNYVPSASNLADNAHVTDEEKIRMKLQEFGIPVAMRETFSGPSVVKYTLKPSRAKRMAEFTKLDKDIAIALSASSVRIEAPIMGTDLVGIEVPNKNRMFVKGTDEMLSTIASHGKLMIPMGVDVYGKTVTKDLAEAPHMLVAGTTGSGKSVFINVVIQSLMAQHTPEELRFVLIDPKRVELSGYKGDPHLLENPIYEIDSATTTLVWLTEEMEERYRILEAIGARNIEEYNSKAITMPRIVVVVDEFADLMLQTKAKKSRFEPNMAENSIVRLAQKARAVGIHVVLGTQRPSTDVVTGLIKANFPTRVAFATAQEVDSRVILDRAGAETLLGKGDMLFMDPASRDLARLQSFYV